MKSIWILGVALNLFSSIYAGPLEVIYSGDACECPSKLGYQVNVPCLPAPPQYMPSTYGYKIEVPPIQAKAKLSYSFDFLVEEPKPPCPAAAEKLNLLTKVDRIVLNKPDCPYTYAPPAPPPPMPPAPAPCSCSRCGVSKPLYRYVNGKIVQPCRCRRPKCKCNLRSPNSIDIESPIIVASGPLERNKNTVRRKRDLERIFFRPRRQDRLRSARYIKLYHKPISAEKEIEKEKENWLNMDFFADANPFKRKSKRGFFPDFRSRIVKRDIKGEYDLLEKERQEMDLTIPEIIQFMPETLQPGFKRGPCQFGCRDMLSETKSLPKETDESSGNQEEQFNESNNKDKSEIMDLTKSPTSLTDDDQDNDMHSIANSFTKRNANGCHYAPAGRPPIPYIQMAPQRNGYGAQNPIRNPTNLQHIPATTLCEQRKLYAAMRRASEPSQHIYDRVGSKYIEEENGQLRMLVSPLSVVSDPFRPDAPPLQYTGDLEIPQAGGNFHKHQDPILGATNYPVQHVSSDVLDRIISDIVYRHPDFIEASSHYGGALVDPEPEQAEQTKDFIKKLIDGRLGLFFEEPQDMYMHYYPVPSFQTHMYNPYNTPRSMAYAPVIY